MIISGIIHDITEHGAAPCARARDGDETPMMSEWQEEPDDVGERSPINLPKRGWEDLFVCERESSYQKAVFESTALSISRERQYR